MWFAGGWMWLTKGLMGLAEGLMGLAEGWIRLAGVEKKSEGFEVSLLEAWCSSSSFSVPLLILFVVSISQGLWNLQFFCFSKFSFRFKTFQIYFRSVSEFFFVSFQKNSVSIFRFNKNNVSVEQNPVKKNTNTSTLILWLYWTKFWWRLNDSKNALTHLQGCRSKPWNSASSSEGSVPTSHPPPGVGSSSPTRT
jgi:hypothetical protein